MVANNGSFDSAEASLREPSAALRMTELDGLLSDRTGRASFMTELDPNAQVWANKEKPQPARLRLLLKLK
jgi:hypothetical protein